MITRLGNIQVGKGKYLYKTGKHIWGTKSSDPRNGSGMSGHVHRLVKGEQSDKNNRQVMKENCRIKETPKDEGDNTCFVWSPPLLSATPLDIASGTSHDLRVDRPVAMGVCMHGTYPKRMALKVS